VLRKEGRWTDTGKLHPTKGMFGSPFWTGFPLLTWESLDAGKISWDYWGVTADCCENWPLPPPFPSFSVPHVCPLNTEPPVRDYWGGRHCGKSLTVTHRAAAHPRKSTESRGSSVYHLIPCIPYVARADMWQWPRKDTKAAKTQRQLPGWLLVSAGAPSTCYLPLNTHIFVSTTMWWLTVWLSSVPLYSHSKLMCKFPLTVYCSFWKFPFPPCLIWLLEISVFPHLWALPFPSKS
jgi:hypothetical protein